MRNPTRRPDRPVLVPNPKAKLLDQVREVMRFHHYSYRTEKTYCQWIRRYLAFHRQVDRSGPDAGWRHPRTLGVAEVAAFLSHLAGAGQVAASTQNQALNAGGFLNIQHSTFNAQRSTSKERRGGRGCDLRGLRRQKLEVQRSKLSVGC